VSDCLFCRIGAKQVAAKLVYEDEEIFAFEDIHPQAPTHILICPRKHLDFLNDAAPADALLLGQLQLVAGQLARERNLTAGYRTVFNNGEGAGQSVFHLHLHLLGGRPFRWPPG
jgi:histidine triad (HIT) family protein